MGIIGIILWVMALLWVITNGFILRERAKNQQSRESMFEVYALFLAVSVIIIPVMSLSPFHLLWMFPASFVLGTVSMIFSLKLLCIPALLYSSLWLVGTHNPGRAFYLAGDYEKAIEYYEEAIQSKPDSAEAHFYLGLAYDKMGDTEQAIESFKTAIRLNPTSREAYFNLGLSYKGLDNQKAIESFKEAICIKPDYDQAHGNLGMVYVEVGDIAKALIEYEVLQNSNEAYASELYSAINNRKNNHLQRTYQQPPIYIDVGMMQAYLQYPKKNQKNIAKFLSRRSPERASLVLSKAAQSIPKQWPEMTLRMQKNLLEDAKVYRDGGAP